MIDTVNSPHIIAATSDSFKALVLDNSNKGPVLANSWSKKAGPSFRQYPILDQLIHHYDGRLLLVNIDVDDESLITREYGITSVPTLKLFRNGQIVETWHGYQSEDDLRKTLDLYVARDSDRTLAHAVQLYAAGEQTQAYELIANAIVEDPINPRLPLAMCKLLKHEERYDEALQLINTMPDDIRKNREAARLHALLSFHIEIDATRDMNAVIDQADSAPDDLEAKQQLAARHVIQAQHEQALQELVKIMDLDPGYHDNYAQKAMLRLFDILGPEHALTSKYRAQLKRYAH